MNKENFKVAEFCYRGQADLITRYMLDMQKIPAFDQDWEFLMSAILQVKEHYARVKYVDNHVLLRDMYKALIESLQWCEKDKIYPRLVDYVNVWAMLKPKDDGLCEISAHSALTSQ